MDIQLVPLNENKMRFNGKVPFHIAKYLKGNELRLYLMLLEYHNDDFGYAFPSYKTIREYFGSGWDDKNIRKHITGLEEKGFIKVIKNSTEKGTSNNKYYLYIPFDKVRKKNDVQKEPCKTEDENVTKK